MTRRYLPGYIFPQANETKEERLMKTLVHMKESNIPGAGFGVFATQRIPKGLNLGPYRGMILSKEQMDTLQPGDDQGLQIVEFQRPDGSMVYIDGESIEPRRSNWARYINDSWNTNMKANLQLNDNGYFVSLCDIPAGCELFWNYGSSYWSKGPKLKTIQIKDAKVCNCAM